MWIIEQVALQNSAKFNNNNAITSNTYRLCPQWPERVALTRKPEVLLLYNLKSSDGLLECIFEVILMLNVESILEEDGGIEGRHIN